MLLSPSLYFRNGPHQGADDGSFLVRRSHQIQLIWWARLLLFPEELSRYTRQLDTWPLQQIRWMYWRRCLLSGSCLISWIHLCLSLQPVNDCLALQDLSSALEELGWIRAILWINFCWRWTTTLLTFIKAIWQIKPWCPNFGHVIIGVWPCNYTTQNSTKV